MAEDASLSFLLVYGKSKLIVRSISLLHPYNHVFEAVSIPNDVLRRYEVVRTGVSGYFNLQAQDELGTENMVP